MENVVLVNLRIWHIWFEQLTKQSAVAGVGGSKGSEAAGVSFPHFNLLGGHSPGMWETQVWIPTPEQSWNGLFRFTENSGNFQI